MTTATTHPATVLVIEDDEASRMLLTYLSGSVRLSSPP